MYFLTLPFLSLPLATLTNALVLTPRATGDACSTPSGDGTCQLTSDCTSQGFNLAGYCPNDPDNVQCCVKTTCSTSSGSGTCMNTGDSCGGSFLPGACPGDDTIQCCVAGDGSGSGSSTPPPNPSPAPSSPPAPSGGGGSGIVSAAVKEEGLPYVWGGGGCAGPSKGGFDCSGTLHSSPSLPLTLSPSKLTPPLPSQDLHNMPSAPLSAKRSRARPTHSTAPQWASTSRAPKLSQAI